MKRIGWLILFAVAILASRPLVGIRLVGFRTATTYDNRPADFPRTVVAIDGRRVTLDDGRRFFVAGPDEDAIAAGLAESEHRVRVEDGALYTPSRVGFCSFDFPQRMNLVTVPVFRDRFRQYGSHLFAGLSTVRPSTTTTRRPL